MIYDINNISHNVVNKYWCVYPYTYRIFVDECDADGGRWECEMRECDRYMKFLKIKQKYYRDAKDCVDEFTAYYLSKWINKEIY